jgi:hypothetical protein
MVNEHRHFIVSWLSRALEEGQLEERPPQLVPVDQAEQHNQDGQDQSDARPPLLPTADQKIGNEIDALPDISLSNTGSKFSSED